MAQNTLALQRLVQLCPPGTKLLTLRHKGEHDAERTASSSPDHLLGHATAYFRATPETLTGDDTIRIPLLQLSEGLSRPPGNVPATLQSPNPFGEHTNGATLVVELMHYPVEFKSSSDLRNLLWDWHERGVGRRTRLLALLAKAGDKKAKRMYLERANDLVQSSKRESDTNHAQALARRAQQYLDVGDPAGALRDVQKGLRIDEKRSLGSTVRNSFHRAGAIAQAIRGRHKDAAEHLEALGLNAQARATYRAMPAFKDFMQSKFADVLAP